MREDSEGPLAFSGEPWKIFFELISQQQFFDGPLKDRARKMVESITLAPGVDVRLPIEDEMLEHFPVLRLYGEDNHFFRFVGDSGGEAVSWRATPERRTHERWLAKAFSTVWEEATGATNEDWENDILDDLGISGDGPPDYLCKVHPELRNLLVKQHDEIIDIDNSSFWFKFNLNKLLFGKAYSPPNASVVPGDLRVNIYKRGLSRLIEQLDGKNVANKKSSPGHS